MFYIYIELIVCVIGVYFYNIPCFILPFLVVLQKAYINDQRMY